MSERIFISYARFDGSAAAEHLIELLAANGHSAWQDLRKLGPEETVWPQIEKALNTAEFLIVLVTPAALKSDYIRKEWREARRNGATIMPVMAMKQSRSTLPRWLRRGEVYDLKVSGHREKFLARLNSAGGIFRADWDAGLEIETFIARPTLFAQIKTQLLSEASEPISLTSALQGRGGYGKSVLAGEIARDPEIRDAYIDGVFWVSLGQDNPDVLGQINYLIQRILGAGGAPDVNTAAEELRRLLEKRDVLIILDDVWRRQDLYPFAKATGQGNATMLATTRKLDALPPSAQTIDISGMEPDEAVALLSYGLAPDAIEQQALSAFASDFWHWPQLLAIANGLLRGRMRDGDTLLHALDTIAENARRGVVPGKDERERTIANVMHMGIDDLGPADRERFKALVVAPEDTAIPVAILAPLWGLSQYEAEEFARLLLDRRLIQSRDLSDLSVGARIRMHDDMLWYLGAIADDDAKRRLHGALLAAHRPSSGNWADLDQGKPALHYLWRHLSWHLEQAGNAEIATALRINYGWIKAKLNLLGIDEVLIDHRSPSDDPYVSQVGTALALSQSVLRRDTRQLAFQLYGRLATCESTKNAPFCTCLRKEFSSFEPISLTLMTPDNQNLRRHVIDEFSKINVLSVSPAHGLLLVGLDNRKIQIRSLDRYLSLIGEGVAEGEFIDALLLECGKKFLLLIHQVQRFPDRTNKVVQIWGIEPFRKISEEVICSFDKALLLFHPEDPGALRFCKDQKSVLCFTDDRTYRISDFQGTCQPRVEIAKVDEYRQAPSLSFRNETCISGPGVFKIHLRSNTSSEWLPCEPQTEFLMRKINCHLAARVIKNGSADIFLCISSQLLILEQSENTGAFISRETIESLERSYVAGRGAISNIAVANGEKYAFLVDQKGTASFVQIDTGRRTVICEDIYIALIKDQSSSLSADVFRKRMEDRNIEAMLIGEIKTVYACNESLIAGMIFADGTLLRLTWLGEVSDVIKIASEKARICLSDDRKMIAIAEDGQDLLVVRLSDLRIMARSDCVMLDPMWCSFTKSDKRIRVGTANNRLLTFDVSTSSRIEEISDEPFEKNEGVKAVLPESSYYGILGRMSHHKLRNVIAPDAIGIFPGLRPEVGAYWTLSSLMRR